MKIAFMRILFAFVCLLVITSCEKEQETSTKCRELQDAFFSGDEATVKEAVTKAIYSLPSEAHTQQNLMALAAGLTNQCGITAKVLCFKCIKTLPEQSEIRLSVNDGTRVLNKTIDISATSITNETMKFVAIHD
jgi:hypothetical protein